MHIIKERVIETKKARALEVLSVFMESDHPRRKYEIIKSISKKYYKSVCVLWKTKPSKELN